MNQLNWYAIETKPNNEQLVCAQLSARGLEAYLPLWQPPWHDGRAARPRPFFPSYLFARVELEQVGVSALCYLPGARRLVSCGERPARVADEVIERIRTRLGLLENQVTDARGQELTHGDAVRITAGYLAGFDAVFDSRLPSDQRVRILVDFIQKGTRVEIERENIVKINLQEWARRQVGKR